MENSTFQLITVRPRLQWLISERLNPGSLIVFLRYLLINAPRLRLEVVLLHCRRAVGLTSRCRCVNESSPSMRIQLMVTLLCSSQSGYGHVAFVLL